MLHLCSITGNSVHQVLFNCKIGNGAENVKNQACIQGVILSNTSQYTMCMLVALLYDDSTRGINFFHPSKFFFHYPTVGVLIRSFEVSRTDRFPQ